MHLLGIWIFLLHLKSLCSTFLLWSTLKKNQYNSPLFTSVTYHRHKVVFIPCVPVLKLSSINVYLGWARTLIKKEATISIHLDTHIYIWKCFFHYISSFIHTNLLIYEAPCNYRAYNKWMTKVCIPKCQDIDQLTIYSF